MAAASLDELFPGRVLLCLGAGAPGDLAAAGIESTKPLATLRETIRVCRLLLSGGGDHAGEIYKVTGRRLPNPTDRVPIVLAASGEKMLELAGSDADGVLISAATSPAFIQWCLAQVSRGESSRTIPGVCRRYAVVYTRIADQEVEALDSIRRTMGFILRVRTTPRTSRSRVLISTKVRCGTHIATKCGTRWSGSLRMMS